MDVAYLKNLQPLVLLHRHHHHNRPPMLGYRHRFDTGQVDQPTEAVLGVLRCQGLDAAPTSLGTSPEPVLANMAKIRKIIVRSPGSIPKHQPDGSEVPTLLPSAGSINPIGTCTLFLPNGSVLDSPLPQILEPQQHDQHPFELAIEMNLIAAELLKLVGVHSLPERLLADQRAVG
jgi:hypothetical protein